MSRFTSGPVKWKRTRGPTIIDGAITATISVTETGGAPPTSVSPYCSPSDVFSNTNTNGTMWTTNHCVNWTGGGSTVQWGFSSQTNTSWTNDCSGSGAAFCNGTHKSKLYCFQQ